MPLDYWLIIYAIPYALPKKKKHTTVCFLKRLLILFVVNLFELFYGCSEYITDQQYAMQNWRHDLCERTLAVLDIVHTHNLTNG